MKFESQAVKSLLLVQQLDMMQVTTYAFCNAALSLAHALNSVQSSTSSDRDEIAGVIQSSSASCIADLLALRTSLTAILGNINRVLERDEIKQFSQKSPADLLELSKLWATMIFEEARDYCKREFKVDFDQATDDQRHESIEIVEAKHYHLDHARDQIQRMKEEARRN